MSTAHMPGPWRVSRGSGGFLTISVQRDGKTYFIADVRGRFFQGHDITVEDRTTEAEANAVLISAAPELFLALTAVIARFESGDFVRNTNNDGDADWGIKAIPILQTLFDAKSALAKAEPPPVPAWDGSDRRSGNGVEHAARDERRGPEGTR